MLIFWRVLLVLGAGLIVWRSASVGLATHYAERFEDGDAAAAEKARAWASGQPEAALAEAAALVDQDPSAAQARLREVYRDDPTNPRALLLLARLAREQGDDEAADALVEQAIRLAPAKPSVLMQAARYWVERGELEKAVGYWSDVLEADPALAERIFPVLLRLTEDPRAQAVLRPLADSPPSWWDRFFAEVAQRALEVETVRALYGLRRASETPVTAAERRAYVARLQREGRITEAYLVWVNGLTPEERRHLGLLFDGGFELEPGQGGFGWRAPRARRVELRNAATYGIEGARALYLRFGGRERRFRHLFQRLYLDPGNYRVSGRVRPDGLDTLGGLRWQVNCLLPDRQQLAESERFLGASDWRAFSFEFAVPDACRYQEIRLVSSGRRAFEHKVSGEIWLDGMTIRKIGELSAAAQSSGSGGEGAASQVPSEAAPRGSEVQDVGATQTSEAGAAEAMPNRAASGSLAPRDSPGPAPEEGGGPARQGQPKTSGSDEAANAVAD